MSTSIAAIRSEGCIMVESRAARETEWQTPPARRLGRPSRCVWCPVSAQRTWATVVAMYSRLSEVEGRNQYPLILVKTMHDPISAFVNHLQAILPSFDQSPPSCSETSRSPRTAHFPPYVILSIFRRHSTLAADAYVSCDITLPTETEATEYMARASRHNKSINSACRYSSPVCAVPTG
eukprot:1918241-Rhodomonas_salina.2